MSVLAERVPDDQLLSELARHAALVQDKLTVG